jgi:hypothetical protein
VPSANANANCQLQLPIANAKRPPALPSSFRVAAGATELGSKKGIAST